MYILSASFMYRYSCFLLFKGCKSNKYLYQRHIFLWRCGINDQCIGFNSTKSHESFSSWPIPPDLYSFLDSLILLKGHVLISNKLKSGPALQHSKLCGLPWIHNALLNAKDKLPLLFEFTGSHRPMKLSTPKIRTRLIKIVNLLQFYCTVTTFLLCIAEKIFSNVWKFHMLHCAPL